MQQYRLTAQNRLLRDRFPLRILLKYKILNIRLFASPGFHQETMQTIFVAFYVAFYVAFVAFYVAFYVVFLV